ncbi:hypothetical protein [Brevibacillus laterosporus]|uniref:hypothetical protein n=1 Tax=Brevibacillus laterosporus TaxID=1465 RepID=UPI000E6C7860|nr:hypothetical protein [Brevibacillus laterosporus]AYB38499.1 hypothetical protein D5F52_09650 [Brevibacillus laterosporus]MBM7111717.1 hypothetical protein [Brevibacillus laterosporus]
MKPFELLGEVEKNNWLNRPSLQATKERIMARIEEAPKSTVFYYDLSAIESINGSGTDELIGKIVKWLREKSKEQDKYLFLDNLSPIDEFDHAYNIHISLEDAKVAVMAKDNSSFMVLGYLGQALKDVLGFVYENKETNAREISTSMDKKLNLASTQLLELYNMRLVRREEVQLSEGGRQYSYKSLF